MNNDHRTTLQKESDSPAMTIRILSVLGGFFAFVCLFGSLLSLGMMKSGITLTVTGLFFIGLTILADRMTKHVFLDTMIVSFNITGYVSIVYGLAELGIDYRVIGVGCMLIALLNFFLSKGALICLISVLAFNIGLSTSIWHENSTIQWSQFIVLIFAVVLFALNTQEAKITTRVSYPKFKALSIGFFLSFAMGMIWLSGIFLPIDKSVWIVSLLLWIGIVFIVHKIINVMEVKNNLTKMMSYLASLLFLIPTLFAPYLCGTTLLLLISWYYGRKSEFVTSIVLLIYMVIKYYYDLQFTLLEKSILLFFTGALLIGIRYFFTKTQKQYEKL